MSAFDRTEPNLEDEFGQRLLRSMTMDVAPVRAKAATLAALGLTSGIAAAQTASAAAVAGKSGVALGAANATTVSGAGITAGASGVFAGGVLKTALLATCVGAAVGSGVIATGVGIERFARARQSEVSTPVVLNPVASVTRSPQRTEQRFEIAEPNDLVNGPSSRNLGPASAMVEAATPSAKGSHQVSGAKGGRAADDMQRAASGMTEARPERAAAQPASAVPSTLQRETAQLDRVRAALRRGDASSAVAELNRYAADFPTGSLRPEAEVLHIEIVLQFEGSVRARSLARAFVERHPTSPHAARLRKSLGL